jgi:1,2-diacylglycerol 3-beta-galactosyltransferase
VDLIYFDAGGGHRASAIALKAVAEQRQPGWQIRMVNLREVLEPIDFIHRTTGVRVEDLYNGMLRHDLTFGVGPMLPILRVLVRRTHSRQVELLARYWREDKPDLVVSLIPHFNRAAFEGLRCVDSAMHRSLTPMVTILTDLADYPPHFWIERQPQYFICGSAMAASQAFAMGHPLERVFRTSGMIVRPEFYRRKNISRALERCRIGLRPDLPTGLVMFGGFGSSRMLNIAKAVADAGLKAQFIFLCGNNQALRERLSRMELPFPHYVEGFTQDVPYFMGLADFFIGKPGPGSLSEALVMGLPVIVERNASTMVQERFNTEWIMQNRLGVVLRSFSDLREGLAPMLDTEQMMRLRQQVNRLNNRAVFEIPEILDAILALRTDQPELYAVGAQS